MKEGMAGQKGKSRLWIGILLLALGVASFVYWGGKKQVWFCDEIYTYESANGLSRTGLRPMWISGWREPMWRPSLRRIRIGWP